MRKIISNISSGATSANKKGPSKMAEGIALHRVNESMKPEGERIFYDPYAIHFVNPEIIRYGVEHPVEARAALDKMNSLFPGLDNSIRARVRYFDDFVRNQVDEGIGQLVIMGAGYDTRAYRIEGLDQIKVFEVDHPGTQSVKIEKIKAIFGSLPGHVVYVSVDFETEDFGQKLLARGYDRSKKTLFVMEGLVMYIPPEAVDATLSFVVQNSGKGSTIIFDYYPRSVVDGTCELEAGRNIHDFVIRQGEPLQFGIDETEVVSFLSTRGFSNIRNVTAEDYKKAYFHGKNESRPVCSLLYFAYAVVE